MRRSRISPLSPDDIARRVGQTGRRVRAVLRILYPSEAPGSGGRWVLTEAQVVKVVAWFAKSSRRPQLAVGARRRTRVQPAAFGSDGLPTDWRWEGHVQQALITYLTNDGWTIDQFANTGIREQGPDVVASRSGGRLLVEVKGYPSIGYRDPRRAAERKPTNPALQATHWYAEALLKVSRLRHAHSDAEIAICVPTAPTYQKLVAETIGVLRLAGIGVFEVDESGKVTVLADPRRQARGSAR